MSVIKFVIFITNCLVYLYGVIITIVTRMIHKLNTVNADTMNKAKFYFQLLVFHSFPLLSFLVLLTKIRINKNVDVMQYFDDLFRKYKRFMKRMRGKVQLTLLKVDYI